MLKNNTPFKPFILTLDDDEDFNLLLVKVLKRLHLDVETTDNAEMFFNRLKNSNPSILIIDLNLGEKFGEGLQVIEKVRKEHGEKVPIIVMTKRSSPEDISFAFEMGASDFLTKPLDDVLLIAKVKQFIRIKDGKPLHSIDEDFFLPFKQIPLGKRNCKFHLKLNITEVSEFGMKLEGDHFIARGTPIKIQSDLTKEIFGDDRTYLFTVHKNWIDNDAGKSGIYVEFDANNESMMSKLRIWLLAKGKADVEIKPQ